MNDELLDLLDLAPDFIIEIEGHIDYPIGTIWHDASEPAQYILTRYVNGKPQWVKTVGYDLGK